MLNKTRKIVVYLDTETLEYMYLNYSGKRHYPVMNKLFNLLHEGFVNNILVVPLALDHILPHIEENKIDHEFLNMMGEMGQVQFLQRFTVKMLQLIRVINFYFEQVYKKEIWKDAFSSDPDERYVHGFNQYSSITAQNTLKALDREKKLSQIYDFIERFKKGEAPESIASNHFRFLWEQFPDFIRPYFPDDGDPEMHINSFFKMEDIKEIPEFHILSNSLYPLFEAYGIEDIEYGLKDDILAAAETISAYMPYCNFYVTVSDIAELFIMNRVHDVYDVRIYDNNES
ncbi:MAG: hypothetical protein J7M24_01810, partial [Candidatus Latescibacteria bacterium]|nr:hypothetical protein [Candidatus Latescibacterota bacterium]